MRALTILHLIFLKNGFHYLTKMSLMVIWLNFSAVMAENSERLDERSLEIASLGAVMSEAILEGGSGAIQRSPQYRFRTRSIGPTPGIIGQHPKFTRATLREQPGVFPGPLLGFDALEFTFTCLGPIDQNLVPIIFKPDGSIIKGKILCSKDPKQTVTVPYPAQTGIYTLFISNNSLKNAISESIRVEVAVHKKVKGGKNTYSRPFDLSTQSLDESTIELVYTAFNSQIELF